MELDSNSILVITGPTASGKTEIALELARKDKNVEIVNADASLLYRGFDIGTAKPSKGIQSEIPHHLIDVLEPWERFNAADYSLQARKTIRDIIEHEKTPIVVGGTGLYIEALFKGLPELDIAEDVLERANLRARDDIVSRGFDAMHEALRELDPELYKQIQRERNPLRLERAWTHYYATGEPLGKARKRKPKAFEYKPKFRLLNIPREELWRRIELRVDQMLENGWLEEAMLLKEQGIERQVPAMRAIGYSELFDVLEEKQSLTKARERITIRTRQYAKRQITWLRSRIARFIPVNAVLEFRCAVGSASRRSYKASEQKTA